jgi:hypothetical protein
MSYKKTISLFFTAFLAGIGIAWLVKRRIPEVPGLSNWQAVLAEKHGAAKAQLLAAAVRQQHTALVAAAQWPENQVLRWHLQANILPGLALYQVLLQEHAGNKPAALIELDEAFRAETLAKSRLLFAPLKVLPAPFWLFKLAMAQMMKRFPVEGWDFTYIENSAECIAFTGTRCFYLKTLTTLGAPELTASFCKTDEVMAELFPSSIRFIRPHTLGRGDAVCDFQYCRVPKLGHAAEQS